MALSFSSTDVVAWGSPSALDNLAIGTFAAWVNVTGFGGNSLIFQKGAPFVLRITTGEDFELLVTRATTNLSVFADLSSNFPAWGTSKWVFVACTFNSAGANADQRLYVGDISTAAIEASSYTGQSVGSGALNDNSAETLRTGNNGAGTAPFVGRVAWVGVWDRVLSSSELHAVQFRPTASADCVLFSHLWAPAHVVEMTGTASATVTGTAAADHAPYRLGWQPGWAQVARTISSEFVGFSDTLVRAGSFIGTRSPEDVFPFGELMVVTVNGTPAQASTSEEIAANAHRFRRLRRADAAGVRR